MSRSPEHRHVFFDPTGRRWKLTRHFLCVIGLILALAGIVFVFSIAFVPMLPNETTGSRVVRSSIPRRQAKLGKYLFGKARADLLKAAGNARKTSILPAPASAQPIVAAFYAPWQETGLNAFRANASKITHLIPEWLHLGQDGRSLDQGDWDPDVTPHNLDVVQIARNAGASIHPILNNAREGCFDPVRVRSLLASPEAQNRLALEVRNFLLREKFHGLNLDFENLGREERKALPAFVHLLAEMLHSAGLSLSVDLEGSLPMDSMVEIARSCDFVVLMAYDEHDELGEAGPIASQGWFESLLDRVAARIPPEKLVVGIGNYAYDWKEGAKAAESISYQSALILARDYRDPERQETVDFDSQSLNPTFDYADDEGHSHEVWMLDAVTAYNQLLAASRYRPRGAAVWALGSEDPGVWTILEKTRQGLPPRPNSLMKVDFPFEVEFEGEGELLSVIATPQVGFRKLDQDPGTALITDDHYLRLPSTYVLKRSGYHPGEIVLTFDDGPDSEYTPPILDLLKRENVPAAFFFIGQNAEKNPGLVRRTFREGHEIGNHTFTHPNLGATGTRLAGMELNATQRLFQSLLGHSTTLFRAPYNADAEPVSAEEVRPVVLAAQLGYRTVGELIDPQDWNLVALDASGKTVERGARTIVEETLKQLKMTRGNMVLLHDGGGDRSRTVEALRILIPELRKRGYRFVSIASLAGESRDRIMPPVLPGDLTLVGLDRLMFECMYWGETLLAGCFSLAILLGVGRVVLVVSLAIRQKRREGRTPSGFMPEAAALVAAYNEQEVIERTVRSLLASRYALKEVIVVDDGSTDRTSDVVREQFGENPCVRLVRQDNKGKAEALNHGLSLTGAEVVVCVDADTQLAPDAVERLLAHFGDPRVGAVAGNVRVGNPVNILTRWQEIEYVTSQNLDRRACAILNAITVVPGAIGAWRKEAVLSVGGYMRDTLAEDMDLTWRLQRAGWKVANEPGAMARTEAPERLHALFRQRFRWSYGTLQSLWKHRGALGRNGWFGRLVLPALWLFQVLFQVVAPLVDLQMVLSLVSTLRAWVGSSLLTHDWQPLPEAMHALVLTSSFYALFVLLELAGARIAYRLEGEKPRGLLWIFVQRFAYRQLLYAVIWKSLVYAVRGAAAGWGKLARTGSVEDQLNEASR